MTLVFLLSLVLVVSSVSPANILILHPLYAGRCLSSIIHASLGYLLENWQIKSFAAISWNRKTEKIKKKPFSHELTLRTVGDKLVARGHTVTQASLDWWWFIIIVIVVIVIIIMYVYTLITIFIIMIVIVIIIIKHLQRAQCHPGKLVLNLCI